MTTSVKHSPRCVLLPGRTGSADIRRGRHPRSVTRASRHDASHLSSRPLTVPSKPSSSLDASSLAALSAAPRWAVTSDNPPLRDNFAPVVGECTLRDLRVEGALPPAVRGVYLRNGPNPKHEPLLGARRYHWFDGDGMVHWVRLGAASSSDESDPAASTAAASYGRRYVRTRGFEQEEAAGRALYTGLRDINPIWPVLLPRLARKMVEWRAPDSPFWVIQSKNTANNGLTYHAGRLLATYESGSAYELALSPELTARGLCDFGGTLSTADYWRDNMTAHPKTCPLTGEMIYIGAAAAALPRRSVVCLVVSSTRVVYACLRQTTIRTSRASVSATAASGTLRAGYNLIDLDGDGETDVTVGIIGTDGGRVHRTVVPASRPSMQHDVGITSTRVVLMDGPLVFDLARVMAGGLPFAFEGAQTMRLGVMPRRGGADDVTWIDTGEPCFAYHVVNCYDDPRNPNRVVVDVCKADATNALGMARGFEGGFNGYGAGEPWESENVGRVGENAGKLPRDDDRPWTLGSHPNAVREGRDVAALWRWVVDVDAATLVSSERMCQTPSDFPCVSPRVVGLPYRFAYTAAYRPVGVVPGTAPKERMDIPSFDRVLKHDVVTGKTWEYRLGDGRACGDIVFVPGDGDDGEGGAAREEDDGYLLVMVHVLDEKAPRTELVVLGRDEEAGGGLAEVAKVHVPVRVPFGFHNEFVPEHALDGWPA